MDIGGIGSGGRRNIGNALHQVQGHANRLSSGRRINSAGEDAAGVAIAAKMLAQQRSTSQAERNSLDGQSYGQVAESAMAEQGELVSRMRELAMQSANGTLNDDDRGAIQKEFEALRSEVDRIANSTSYNGSKPLSGDSVEIQVGTDASSDSQVSVDGANTSAAALGIDSTDVSTAAGAQAALADMDGAIDAVSSARGDVGATMNRLDSVGDNLRSSHENISAARSRIADADVAKESAGMVSGQIRMRAAIAVEATSREMHGLLLNLVG